MRLLAAVLALSAASAAAETPPHLERLPGGVLERGEAPLALAAAREGSRARVWLPGGERTFEVERVVEAGANATRFGRIPGVGHGAVTLGPDGGFGRITQGATVWMLEYRGGEAFAIRAGEGGLALADYDHGARMPPGGAAKAAAPATVPPKARIAARTVDFIGLYDADFAARYPGALAATRIAHFVALANQAFVDSDVGVTLRTVLTQAAPGAVAPSALDNIDDLYAAQQVGGSFAGVDVMTLRALNGADLVTFFRAHDLYAREVCGVAFFPVDLRTGVNVVMDGESGGSTCDDYTFAHEVGHNFGAGHQFTGFTSFPGHAFHRPGQFTTIMGSLGTGKPDRHRVLGYYSSPRIACGNRPCGSAIEDNARVMNANADLVAGYVRPGIAAHAARPAPVLADSDGDGVIDRIDAFPFDAARSVDSDGDGVADADDAFPDNSTEWADSDGGGFGNNADTDDDNDGVPDAVDAFPLDPAESADADGDGWGDVSDEYDNDPHEQRDTDAGGLGDRADGNDDNDGITDLAPFAAAADGELLVADGATDRILRFRGSDYAPLGTLLQLGASEVTFRSGLAGAPDGGLYFVAASQLRVLDRLRSTSAELMLDPASHPLVGTGFPMSPVVLGGGDVIAGEMGNGGLLLAQRPAPSRVATPLIRRFTLSSLNAAPHVTRENSGDVLVLDGVDGSLRRYQYAGDPLTSDPVLLASFPNAVPALASGDIEQGPNGLLYWVDRRDGAVRSLDVTTGGDGGFAIADADAAAIAVSPDDTLFVARRSGGVRAYDGTTGADLGLVVPAAGAGQPLALTFVAGIADTSLPPYLSPAPPAPVTDASTTPAVGGTLPPPPPCTTDCIDTRSGGGPFDPWLALAFAVLAGGRCRRRYTSLTPVFRSQR